MKKIYFLLVMFMVSISLFGQPKSGIEMVEIPASDGAFTIGGADARFWPSVYFNTGVTVQATVKRSYMMQTTEMTQGMWKLITGETPGVDGPGNPLAPGQFGDDYPVTQVPYVEALRFCNALSIYDGLEPCYTFDNGTISTTDPAVWPDWSGETTDSRNVECDYEKSGYRLPTLGEWIWAAKGGDDFLYGYTDDLAELDDLYAWTDVSIQAEGVAVKNSYQLVATKFENEYGLFDMIGNSIEFTWGWAYNYAQDAELTFPDDAIQYKEDGSHKWDSWSHAEMGGGIFPWGSNQYVVYSTNPSVDNEVGWNEGFRVMRKVEPTVGISAKKAENNMVNLYPTSTSDRLNIRFSDGFYTNQKVSIKIVGIDGRTHMQKLVDYDKIITLDVSALNKGMYLCVINSNSESRQSLKFIKQ